MAIHSSKKTSRFPKGVNDKAERGISSPARSKLAAKPSKSLSGRAKRALIHLYQGPRKRPIE